MELFAAYIGVRINKMHSGRKFFFKNIQQFSSHQLKADGDAKYTPEKNSKLFTLHEFNARSRQKNRSNVSESEIRHLRNSI